MHNIPGEEKNAIICKLGSFTCSVISCEIILLGKTSHAAEPWNSVSPYDAAQAITKEISSYNNHDILSSDFCITTLIEFRVGRESYGVAAGQGILRFTIRTTVDKKLLNIKKDIEEIVKQETKKTMGLKSEISWLEYFAASNNSETAVSRVKESAESLGIKYVEKKNPFFGNKRIMQAFPTLKFIPESVRKTGRKPVKILLKDFLLQITEKEHSEK